MLATGTAGPSTTAPAEHDSPSLADHVGDMFGDFLPVDESVPTSAPDASATDAPTPSGSEGSQAADAEHAEPPAPADAASPAPDPDQAAPTDPTTAPTPGDDPLAGYTTLAYQHAGQSASFDGIHEHPEYGAIVDPEALPALKQRLAERDVFAEQSKAITDRYHSLEQATRWEVTNAQGQKDVLTGLAGLEAQRAYMARTLAVTQAIASLLDEKSDPAELAGLLAFDQAQQRIVWDTAKLRTLTDRVAVSAEQADWRARRALDPYRAALASAPTDPQPVQIAAVAPQTVEAAAKTAGVTSLLPEDKQFLAEQLPRYVRAPTAEERRADPTLGAQLVDQQFVALVKQVGAMRAGAAKAVQATSAAERANAAKLAAAKARPATQPARQSRTATPAVSPTQSADDAFDLALRASAAAMRQRR